MNYYLQSYLWPTPLPIPPPFIFWFSKKIFWYVCEGEYEGAIIYYLEKKRVMLQYSCFSATLSTIGLKIPTDILMTSLWRHMTKEPLICEEK